MSSKEPLPTGEGQGVGVIEVENPPSQERSRLSLLASKEPTLATLDDHFTLPTISNIVRFRNKRNAARVYESKGVQLIMEENYDKEHDRSTITVRRLSDSTAGVTFLRALYSIVCALWTGFFFVFCLQLLLFLVLDLAVESGATHINAEVHIGPVIGVILAIIVFVHGFSEAMVIASHYIMDTWSGHFFAKQFIFSQMGDVAIEWVCFTFFLGVPLTVMCVALLAQSDQWWSVTALTWFGFVMAFFVIFCSNVVYYEVKAAYDFCKNRNDADSDHWIAILKRCIILRQTYNYSGKTKTTFLSRSYFSDTEDTEDSKKTTIFENTRSETFGWWAKITKLMPESLYKQLDEPQKLFTIEDVQDYRPFLTRNTWSLEKIFCRPKNSRYIAIVNGPGALTKSQIRSSIICSIMGSVLIVMIIISFLVWFRIPGAFVAFVFVLCMLFSYSSLTNAINLFKVGKDLVGVKLEMKTQGRTAEKDDEIDEEGQPNEKEEVEATEEEEGVERSARQKKAPEDFSQRVWEKAGTAPSEAVFLVSDYKRVNEITPLFCWILFGLEIGILFLFPLLTLLIINWNMGVIFIIVAVISGTRHYVNAQVVIEETGNMELVGGDTPEKKWENKSRLNEIVSAITVAQSRKLWVSVLGAGGFAFLAIFLGAVGSSTESTSTETYTYLPNFYYPPMSDDMRYPTCTLSNINGGFGAASTLSDFAFLSSIAYRPTNLTQPALDQWFTDTVAIDEQDMVDDFRAREDPDNLAVNFKLVSFPEFKLAMILIRGTSNNWDMLADSQLWSAAALMQGLRAILPAGEIWTPIFAQLVNWITTLQSQSLDKVSFYTLTKKFADELKQDTQFTSVQVTGHSLGGGLAMITGAQAGIPAIGLSGPNALISGKSFDPPVTEDQMNRYTFNIIPNRDIVPMLDDVADQFQYIRCESPAYDFIGCHYAKRSLCEILYTCGSGSRPAICNCATEYGYPKPITDGDEDFDEMCGIN